LPDLLGIPADKINEQCLYRALDALLPHKEALSEAAIAAAGRRAALGTIAGAEQPGGGAF
jgi:hypothetical protein